MRLVQAKAKTAELEARLDQAQRMSPTAPHPLDTPALAALRRALADLAARQSRLLVELGPRHPLVGSLDEEMASAARQIDGEIARITDLTRAELEATRAGGTALEAGLRKLDEEAASRDAAEAALRSLQREVAAAEGALAVALRKAASASSSPAAPTRQPVRVAGAGRDRDAAGRRHDAGRSPRCACRSRARRWPPRRGASQRMRRRHPSPAVAPAPALL